MSTVELYPGQVNDWVFAVTGDLARSDRHLEVVLRRVLSGLGIPGAGQSDTDLIETSTGPIVLDETRAVREELDTLPMLRSGPLTYARVQFPVRGQVSAVRWPAERVTAGLHLGPAPDSADVMLVAAGAPVGGAGDEPSVLEDVLDTELPSPTEIVRSPAIGVAAGVFLSFGALYLLLKDRRG